MKDPRQTDPRGCVHRFSSEAGGFECRAHPMKPLLGGARDTPAIVHRFPACVHRCGEYDIGPPPEITITPDIDPQQVEEFRRAWAGARPLLIGGVPLPSYERAPGAAYAEPAPEEDWFPSDAERAAVEEAALAAGAPLVEVERTDWGDITRHPDGRTTYSGLVCRGSYALGSACGQCARCAAERGRREATLR